MRNTSKPKQPSQPTLLLLRLYVWLEGVVGAYWERYLPIERVGDSPFVLRNFAELGAVGGEGENGFAVAGVCGFVVGMKAGGVCWRWSGGR